jgi:hypothetical protein
MPSPCEPPADYDQRAPRHVSRACRTVPRTSSGYARAGRDISPAAGLDLTLSQQVPQTLGDQVLQHLGDVLPGRHLRVELQDSPFLVDEARHPLRGPRRGVLGRAVGEAETPVGVAEEREGEGELLREGRVVLRPVEGRAEDRGVQLLEVADSITESDALGRSAGGIGLREEPEQHFPPAKVPERDPAAVAGAGGEVRGGIAGLQHGARIPHSGPRRNVTVPGYAVRFGLTSITRLWIAPHRDRGWHLPLRPARRGTPRRWKRVRWPAVKKCMVRPRRTSVISATG